MRDERKTKSQLIQELQILRQRLCEDKASGMQQHKSIHRERSVELQSKPAKAETSIEATPENELILSQRYLTENELDAMLGQLPCILWSTDRDLRIVSSMGAALSKIKLRPYEITGTTVYEYPLSQDVHKYMVAAHRRALSGEPAEYDLELNDRSFHATIIPLRDRNSDIIGTIGLALDMTDSNRAEQQLLGHIKYIEKLYYSIHEVVLTVKMPSRTISFVNHAIADIFGYKPAECIGKTTEFLYASRRGFEETGARLAEHSASDIQPFQSEQFMKRKDGRVFAADISTSFLKGIDGNTYTISVIRDITERKKTEDNLRLKEERLSKAQAISHLGYWEWDIVNDVFIYSSEACEIFALPANEFEVTPASFLQFIHPADRKSVLIALDSALQTGRPYNIDHRIIRADNSIISVHEEGEITRDGGGNPVKMMGIIQDITSLKKEEVGLRNFTHKLVEIQEEERRELARDLHDRTAQSLAMIKILIARARRIMPEQGHSILNQADDMTSDVIGHIRELMSGLSPHSLYDLGVVVSFKQHFERYTEQTGIPVKFDYAGFRESIPQNTSLAAFRIVQEALNNVTKYAMANEVIVKLRRSINHIHVRVEDNGNGFDPTEVGSSCMGIRGMQERAIALGGELTVYSTPGFGTCIIAELPTNPSEATGMEVVK